MCGIFGLLGGHKIIDSQVLSTGCSLLKHRGPDSDGIYLNQELNIGLGHTRLAILDLSPAGHQPMISRTGRYIMTYNGEVYNFREIRAELQAGGSVFNGDSDTEVILEAFENWGTERTVARINGMFAIGLLDLRDREFTLIRDRIGIKPLYYGVIDGQFGFASELRIFNSYWHEKLNINKNALSAFLRYSYVPAPLSIFSKIYKLAPGCILKIDLENNTGFEKIQINKFWDLGKIASELNVVEYSDADALELLKTNLGNAVKQRMVADVPLGAFLSGGIDSSMLVALMQSFSNDPILTFSIGFEEEKYNEAVYAKRIADALGTRHTEFYLSVEECKNLIPALPSIYDEPFGDSSQLPTYLVSKLASESVKVALSGDGGDELFYGYLRYKSHEDLWKQLKFIPYWFRSFLSAGMGVLSRPAVCSGLGLNALLKRDVGDLLTKIKLALKAKDSAELYFYIASQWNEVSRLITFEELSYNHFRELAESLKVDSRLQLTGIDLLTYVPDDLLVKVDRASMAQGLEVRVPFLDYKCVESFLALNHNLKYRQGKSKWLVKELLKGYLPESLFNRPKMGFSVPIDIWLRTSLKSWAEDLLFGEEFEYLNSTEIRRRWSEHQAGNIDWSPCLWNILMFKSWANYWSVKELA